MRVPAPTTTRRRPLVVIALVLLAALGTLGAACVPPPAPAEATLGAVQRSVGAPSPVLPNVSDPAVVVWEGRYYVYGSDHHHRAPVTVVADIDRGLDGARWQDVTHDAMPTQPAWAANAQQLWAPTVARFGSRWVMFFGTDRRNPPQPHNAQCIGRAFADHPAGPFQPEPAPWNCGIGGAGGALDPELFTDAAGQRWLLMTYSDTNAPIRSVRLDDAANATGAVYTILARQWPWEHWFIENPSMVHDPVRGDYVLAYSAGRWYEAVYSTGIARCVAPSGPCVSDRDGPWISNGQGRSGIGGLTFFADLAGQQRALVSSWAAGWEAVTPRAASVLRVDLSPTLVAR